MPYRPLRPLPVVAVLVLVSSDLGNKSRRPSDADQAPRVDTCGSLRSTGVRGENMQGKAKANGREGLGWPERDFKDEMTYRFCGTYDVLGAAVKRRGCILYVNVEGGTQLTMMMLEDAGICSCISMDMVIMVRIQHGKGTEISMKRFGLPKRTRISRTCMWYRELHAILKPRPLKASTAKGAPTWFILSQAVFRHNLVKRLALLFLLERACRAAAQGPGRGEARRGRRTALDKGLEP